MITISDGILAITISTAEKGTSLNFSEGIEPGTAALRDPDPSVGAVLLGGSGPNFCAGADVLAMGSAPDRGDFVRGLAESMHDFLRALREVPVPVVAAVHGWAAGAGMGLVLAADIAIGGPSTRLQPAFVGIGLTADSGTTWSLPRIVGIARAREIMLTNPVITGEDAIRLGILSRLVGDDEVRDEARRVALTLATGPRDAHAGIKSLLARSHSISLSDQLDLERDSITAAADSANGREGVDAFVQKRRPQFNAQ